MATPIRADIGEGLETMWDSMIDLLLVAVLMKLDGSVSDIVARASQLTLTVSAFDLETHFVTTFG